MQLKNTKKRGISFVGIIIFVGLIALIAWGLNYIITKDYIVVRPPTPAIPDNTAPVTTNVQATSTTVAIAATSTKPVATSTTTVTQPTKQPTQTSSDLTVTFTSKGFSPALLKVIKGQTVTFVNNSSAKMWVASNPFPSSSDYPAFNEKSGVDSGATWSFTFDKTGTWFYHNHYTPAVGAKIVVNAK